MSYKDLQSRMGLQRGEVVLLNNNISATKG